MSLELPLSNLSVELRRSLLYGLERHFPDVDFVVNERLRSTPTLVVKADPAPTEIESQIRTYIESFCRRAGPLAVRFEVERIWQNKEVANLEPGTVGCMTDAATPTSLPGVQVLSADIWQIVELIDQICIAFAAAENAAMIGIPSLMARGDLEKCGYWQREEQQISVVNPRLNPPIDATACLSPAACLPLYPVLGAHGLGASSVYSSRCGVFRWEGGRFPDSERLSRLWEYHVRELVFFGKRVEVEGLKKRYIDFAKWLTSNLGLNAEICTASDTFFHPESVNLAMYQLMEHTKLELRVKLEQSEIAVSSFNNHDRHFVDAFGIEGADEDFGSACVGFGLERLAFACLATMSGSDRLDVKMLETLAKGAVKHPWVSV